MTVSFSIKSILAASLVLLMSFVSSTARAYNITYPTYSNCVYNAVTGTIDCSIDPGAILKGLRNVSKTPTAYTASISRIFSGAIFCTNPADNAVHAQGVPFYDVVITDPLTSEEAISPDALTKNGKTLADLDPFEDPQLIAALADAGFVVTCQNENWYQRIIVTRMQAFGQIVTEDDLSAPTCDLTPAVGDPLVLEGCTPQDNLLNYCELPEPYLSDPQQALGTVVPYSCTEICHDADPALCNIDYDPSFGL
jgi:hypothetical protein